MSSVSVAIGRNLRQIRTTRGLTLQEMAYRISEISDGYISASLIGAWQRSERRICAEYILCAARVLQCSVLQLFGIPESLKDAEYVSDHEKSIIEYALNSWTGDWHPLVQLAGLYMASDPQVRISMVDGALRIFGETQNRRIKVPYDVRTDFIQRKRNDLK